MTGRDTTLGSAKTAAPGGVKKVADTVFLKLSPQATACYNT